MAVLGEQNLEERLEEFRRTLVPDLYGPSDFIPWESIEQTVEQYSQAAVALEVVSSGSRATADLASLFESEPTLLGLLHVLFVAPSDIGFSDGREFPTQYSDVGSSRELADLVVDLGLWRLIESETHVLDQLRVGAIALDARRRGFRRSDTIEQIVDAVLNEALQEASKEIGRALERMPASELPPEARRRNVEAVVGYEGKPIAAVTSVFQAQSGGNPQRVLSQNLPLLQQELDSVPISLIVIADGRGVMEASDRVLLQLLSGVASCLSLQQASDHGLSRALVSAALDGGLRAGGLASVGQIITSALDSEMSVDAVSLPVDEDAARLALAAFKDENPQLGLELSSAGDQLAWSRHQEVAAAAGLVSEFDSRGAIALMSDLLEAASAGVVEEDGVTWGVLTLGADPIVPGELMVGAVTSAPDAGVMTTCSQRALSHTPEARFMALISPEPPEDTLADRHRIQRALSKSVVVLTPEDLERFAKDQKPPRDGFVQLVLEQSDLSKVSPFVLSSATPRGMFYGREVEEATMLDALATTSIAVLGGRRIGKTSLLQHVNASLADSGFSVFYGDCQAVRNWADFGQLAGQRWNVSLPSEFRPVHLYELVDRLKERSESKLVFLLDEIDHLLDWDTQHTEDEVPEAFFRACRALSQEGRAQFVFSGERVIAKKLWDPESPHWNFCRELPLRQLSHEASRALLSQPLHSLQVEILNEDEVLREAISVSTGHPQILQFIGDRLVRQLNEKPINERTVLTMDDLRTITEVYAFREHYLETYWGQATQLERVLSALLAAGDIDATEANGPLESLGINPIRAELALAMRMLELYGIADPVGDRYVLRAEWFQEALSTYGGVSEAIERLAAHG